MTARLLARLHRVRVDGVTHAEAGRRVDSDGTESHVLLCVYWRRQVQPGDALLGKDAAVTCLWCAAESS